MGQHLALNDIREKYPNCIMRSTIERVQNRFIVQWLSEVRIPNMSPSLSLNVGDGDSGQMNVSIHSPLARVYCQAHS